jgi:hypothetical protein
MHTKITFLMPTQNSTTTHHKLKLNIFYFKDVVDDLFTVEELYGCYSVRTIGGELLTVVDSPAQLLRYVGNTLGLQAYSNLRATLRVVDAEGVDVRLRGQEQAGHE